MTDHEKSTHEYISRVDTHSSNDDTKHPLEKAETHETIAAVDLGNHQAFKGDDSDGKVNWTTKRLLAACFLCMLYTGSQIPLYFVGGSLSFIAADIGGADVIGWIPVANTLSISAVAPFVGYLQDIFGKRYIALCGALSLCVGCAVLATAHELGPALVGMGLAGAGAGIGELTGLAGLAETVPVKHRGYSLAVLTAFVVPFCPYVMYSELLSTRGAHPTWRWGIWICLIYNAITMIGLAFCYFPIAHPRAAGLSVWSVIKKIDIVGGFLSIVGLTLFLVALQSGGYTHPWTSAFTLSILFIGIAMLVAFFIWEVKFARHPVIPKELFTGQGVVAPAFAVAFVAGMNFFSLLNFWPLTISHVWDAVPVQVGIRGLPVAIFTAFGAIFWNALLSFWRGSSKWILLVSSAMLTGFGGALACMTPHNSALSVTLAGFAAFGLGGVIVPSATVAMIAAPDALITTCAALSLSVRAVGGSIGYSIYYSIFVKKLTKVLPVLVATYAVKAGLPLADADTFVGTFLTAPTKITAVPGVTPEVIEAATLGVQWAYAESLHLVWYTSIAFGVCAMICSVLIPNTKKFETNRVAVDLH